MLNKLKLLITLTAVATSSLVFTTDERPTRSPGASSPEPESSNVIREYIFPGITFYSYHNCDFYVAHHPSNRTHPYSAHIGWINLTREGKLTAYNRMRDFYARQESGESITPEMIYALFEPLK